MSLSSSASSTIFTNNILQDLPSFGVVNIYGPHGSGKSTYFKSIKHVSFDHDILKSKEKTMDFMEMMKYSKLPLVLDDFELVENMPVVKEILEIPVTKFLFFIVTHEKLASVKHHYEFNLVPIELFAKSCNVSVGRAENALKKAHGNMETAKLDLVNFESFRDLFPTPKEYISTLIKSHSVSEYIDKHLCEHGNTLGIVHENYPDYSESLHTITHSLSDADLIDMKIYSDVSWDLMNYFNVSACLIPSLYMSNSKDLDTLRPGSIWTKTSNMLMRKNRLKKLKIDRDDAYVWALKANAGHTDIPFDSYDLDSINQLSITTKIKSRVLSLLKKKCRTKE